MHLSVIIQHTGLADCLLR